MKRIRVLKKRPHIRHLPTPCACTAKAKEFDYHKPPCTEDDEIRQTILGRNLSGYLQLILHSESPYVVAATYLNGSGRVLAVEKMFRGEAGFVEHEPRVIAMAAAHHNAHNVVIAYRSPGDGALEEGVIDEMARQQMVALNHYGINLTAGFSIKGDLYRPVRATRVQ